MSSNPLFTDIIVWCIASIVLLATVFIQYEAMLTVSDHIVPWALRMFRGRVALAISMAALMIGHIAEIWLFAVAYMVVMAYPELGSIAGGFDNTLGSFVYFSTVCYTSLGDNRYHPVGSIRNLAAAETLAGLMMITWSASFTYLKMEEIWRKRRKG